eukprot:comp23938_c0_seq1/m.42297 comp23938_c0_seq1/g.42297  ORF comp23938_c0_seq1/g.42297 comp23938_c0_seq1/m.42297 type:complete len:1031 (-) comp23938_c0_seq1:272-3364(-)
MASNIVRRGSNIAGQSGAGLHDFVLLEDYKSEDAFYSNLRVRFLNNEIYTYIGDVVVSVNPYKDLSIYGKEVLDKYRGKEPFENPPHVYAIADRAYRALLLEGRDQCVLISGESGAGKTEASKHILHYIAAMSTHTREVEVVRDRLLESNPVLEAFGNALTLRNDNSSRFGKYMDIQFDFKGEPMGGVIINYLLEKSRVVRQAPGERNFHIFYQLLSADPTLLDSLGLTPDPTSYHYLKPSGPMRVSPLNDAEGFKSVNHALNTLGFTNGEQELLFNVVAAVLHLGNITFSVPENQDHPQVEDMAPLSQAARLLGVSAPTLAVSLTHRSIVTGGTKFTSPLTLDQAEYARDALAKSLYERLFSWLVTRLNSSLSFNKKDVGRPRVIGVLDIYGFELFEANGFEQFCINYCNEKLQQLFIELTLQAEQTQYAREGLKWEHVEFFDNSSICALIEERHKGIISLLDEECLRPGPTSDTTFLQKIDERVAGHPHYMSKKTAPKEIEGGVFRIRHYAGTVEYRVDGFVDKNNDLLFRDLKESINGSNNPLVAQLVSTDELESRKRPQTAGTQFKNSLSALITTLQSKQPAYIRCIKPNTSKKAAIMDEQLVRHQIRYLGLLENLRVRRAGFAFRRSYDIFLKRFSIVSPTTWPKFTGTAREGTQHVMGVVGLDSKEEAMYGKTMIFIKSPHTLTLLEAAYSKGIERVTVRLQAGLRMLHQKHKYNVMRKSVTKFAAIWKGYAQRKNYATRKASFLAIRRFVQGFMARNKPKCPENEFFLTFTRQAFLQEARHRIQKAEILTSDQWMTKVPQSLTLASQSLHAVHVQLMLRRYLLHMTPEREAAIKDKIVASNMLKGKKASYPKSVARPFGTDRGLKSHPKYASWAKNGGPKFGESQIKYACPALKVNRTDYKTQAGVLVVTEGSIYFMEGKALALKYRIPLDSLTDLAVSDQADGVLVVRSKNAKKGDIILHLGENLIECLVRISNVLGNSDRITVEPKLTHTMSNKTCRIEIAAGNRFAIAKAKEGCTVTDVA